MDCWEVLGIERFSDKKTIKIAYAKQLKLHRPDEDPEGFEQLHRAYKAALSWTPGSAGSVDWMHPEPQHSPLVTRPQTPHRTQDSFDGNALQTPKEPSDQDLVEVILESLKHPLDDTSNADLDSSDWEQSLTSDIAKPELSETDRQLLDEIHSQERSLRADWQLLHEKTNEIIQSKACNDLKAWSFLDSLVSMRDLEFRKSTGDDVFEMVARANVISLANKHLHIKRPVLNYLNKHFSWDKKWQEYQLLHTRSMLNAVYPYLEEAEKPVKGISKKRELYYYRRGAAFAIDLSILFLPMPVFAISKGFLEVIGLGDWFQQLAIDGAEVFMLWMFAYLLLLIPVQEASKYQATVGKRLLNLQVIDKRGDRIGLIRSFWRSLVTVLCCAGIKVVVFINFALSYWRSEILQDTLSRSYVILRPGYFDE